MTNEKIFFEGMLVGSGALPGKIEIQVLHDDDEDYRFSFIVEPVPGQDPNRVRVIMHRTHNGPPLVNLQGADDAIPAP